MSFNNSTYNTTNTQVYEILAYANKLVGEGKKEEAINYLRNNRSKVVIEGYLKMAYDPSIVFQLPPGQPPFKKQLDVPDGYCLTDLKQEFRRMRIFTDATMNIQNLRREQLWIQMCEGLFWKEADLIGKIKDRRITDIYDAFTPDFVNELFPGVLPSVVAEPVPDENLAPVDFGEDPSKISTIELIREAFEKEVEETLSFDDWKKVYFTEKETQLKAALSMVSTVNVEDEIARIATQEYTAYVAAKEPTVKKVTAGAKKKTSTSAKKTTQENVSSKSTRTTKKTTTPTNVAPKERKKPGPKPKAKIPS